MGRGVLETGTESLLHAYAARPLPSSPLSAKNGLLWTLWLQKSEHRLEVVQNTPETTDKLCSRLSADQQSGLSLSPRFT